MCGAVQFWVVCCALPKQGFLYPQEPQDAMGEQPTSLTHLPGTGQALRRHCIKCNEPDSPMRFLDPVHLNLHYLPLSRDEIR